jgi:hypothetical protein
MPQDTLGYKRAHIGKTERTETKHRTVFARFGVLVLILMKLAGGAELVV